ncbi:MAG: lpxC [Caulobacteraceae bacterium]|nr:lpxC [Caulobacteraceae bacterium]
MASPFQHTINAPVPFAGLGVHSGQRVNVTVAPAAVDAGIAFLRTDVTEKDPRIPARADRVVETRLGTVIANDDGVRVATIEHLMAAFCGLGIDNALVSLDGPEAPIMDGSCAPFVRALDGAGRRGQQAHRRFIEILEPIEVADGEKRATLRPAEGFEVAFEISFETAAIGRQSIDTALDEEVFRREFADCRTFGFLHEVEALRAAGLAQGGSLDNVVVIDGGAVLNPAGLRRPDEFVRHKAIDAIGDLYLLGGPLIGRYEGLYSGHALNNALARAVLARPSAWRVASGPVKLARAV